MKLCKSHVINITQSHNSKFATSKGNNIFFKVYFDTSFTFFLSSTGTSLNIDSLNAILKSNQNLPPIPPFSSIKSLISKTFSTKDFEDKSGGYNFEWYIDHITYQDFDFKLYGKALTGGSVNLIDGRHLSLNEALEDDEIGYEIQEEVNLYNEKFGNWEKIKRFELTPTVWSIDGGELTPTLKLKRKIVKEKYINLYNKIYNP